MSVLERSLLALRERFADGERRWPGLRLMMAQYAAADAPGDDWHGLGAAPTIRSQVALDRAARLVWSLVFFAEGNLGPPDPPGGIPFWIGNDWGERLHRAFWDYQKVGNDATHCLAGVDLRRFLPGRNPAAPTWPVLLFELAWSKPSGSLLRADRRQLYVPCRGKPMPTAHGRPIPAGEEAEAFTSTLEGSPWAASMAAVDLLLAGPEPATEASKPRKTAGRKRATKDATELRLIAAKIWKVDHPGASTVEVAGAVGVSRQTLESKPEWSDWCMKVEAAAHSGKLDSLKASLDARTGEFVARQEG